MLALKLKRIGKKHQASFRVIVAEKRSKLNGRSVEDLGWYNPHQDKSKLNKERILYWIKNGAQSTDTVHNLLISQQIIQGKKIAVHKKSKTKTKKAQGTGQTLQAQPAGNTASASNTTTTNEVKPVLN